MTALTPRRLLLLCLLIAPFAALSVWSGLDHGVPESGDLQWQPARMLLEHRDPYAVYLEWRASRSGPEPFMLAQRPNYPAAGLVALWPLAALPWQAAKAAWALLNIAASLGLVLLIVRGEFPPEARRAGFALLALLALAAMPERQTLHVGQHGIVSLAAFAAAVALERAGKRVPAALLLALAWLKYSVTLPLSLYFLARGRLGVLAGALLAEAAATLFAGWWTGTSPLRLVYEPLLVNREGGIAIAGYADLTQLLARFGPAGEIAAILAIAALVAVAGMLVRTRPALDRLLLSSLLALVAAVVVFHGNYDMMLLVYPAAYALRAAVTGAGGRAERLLAIAFAALVACAWYGEAVAHQLWRVASYGAGFAAERGLARASIALAYLALALCLARCFAARGPAPG